MNWKYLVKRFSEPSSWAGIATIVSVVAPTAMPTASASIQVITAAAGVLAMILPEAPHTENAPPSA
ncbi:MAG: hypothetical protein HQL99_03700 [Magnetococcales bacterium]|nr:hypothetical protein [Magnetococcales bacterium]